MQRQQAQEGPQVRPSITADSKNTPKYEGEGASAVKYTINSKGSDCLRNLNTVQPLINFSSSSKED